jgi:hypothetical protein
MTPPIRIGKRSAGLSGAGQDGRGVGVVGSGWRSGALAGALDGGMRSSPFAKKYKLGEPSDTLETANI